MEAHWEFNQIEGTSTPDNSIHGYAGALLPSGYEPALNSEGKIDNCLEFNGVGYVKISEYNGISGTHTRTAAAWFKTTYTANQTTILQWGKAETGKLWMLYIKDRHATCAVYGGGIEGTTDVADGRWHHVAAVLEEGQNHSVDIKLYVDGRPEGNALLSCTTDTSDDENVHIGVWNNTTLSNYIWHFNGLIDDVRIYNRALEDLEIRALYSRGGGIYGNGTGAAISHCIIRDNEAGIDGGGIWNADGDILNCFILNNDSAGCGGGLGFCDGRIINCVIADNQADSGGGADSCSAEITNCTIVRNSASAEGDGLRDCSGTIANCILWDNGDDLLNASSLHYCCVEDGDQNGTAGNFKTDPNFIDIESIEGPDGLLGTEDDGLHLSEGSPCRDSGDANYCDTSFDILGRNRITDSDWDSVSIIDRGAYENPSVWYVDCGVNESGSGHSWQSAFKTIQEGINAGRNGDLVLIADGIYTGGGYTDTARNRDLDFDGRAITLRSLNGPENCIIDCNGLPESPHRAFYFHHSEGSDSVVSGFTIQNGYVNSDHPDRCFGSGCGGAIACGDYVTDPHKSASPTILNCIFRNNHANQYGGGLFCIYYSNAIIINCIVVANSADDDGGGMYSKYLCNPKIQNCTFVMNTGSNAGGLFVYYSSYVSVTNCIFWKNNTQISGTTGNVSYSCIQDGYQGIGNIDANPNFIRLPDDGGDGWGIGQDDYGDLRLGPISPCIDAGTNDPNSPLPIRDIIGSLRRIDDPNTPDTGYGISPIVDMGACEYVPPAGPTDPNMNYPLQVNAGTDKIIPLYGWADLSDASASDADYLWTKVDGPGSVTFDPVDTVLNPTVWFSSPGDYTLRLRADDGQQSGTDEVSVTVVRVEAGGSQTIRLPNQAMLDASILGGTLENVEWKVVSLYSDANDVVFGSYDETDYDTTARFTTPGRYMLRITAEFAGFAGIKFSDETVITVLADSTLANNAPLVRASADPNTITSPVNTTYLQGLAADDGLPKGNLKVWWQQDSSSTFGQAFFGDYSAEDPNTTVTFSQPGAYGLSLVASDGVRETRRQVLVQVLPPSAQSDNGPPSVLAGDDQTIHRSPFSRFTITLSGASVIDTTPTGILSRQWTVTGGPQSGLAINDPTAEKPQLTFFETGVYTLLLTASDGQYTATDQVTLAVTTDSANAAFQITAGPDQAIILPAAVHLTEAAVMDAADPNEPYPLEWLYIEWSKVSGPGLVEFFSQNDPNNTAPQTELNPSVHFSKAGTYTLLLQVTSSTETLLDEIEIIVKTGRRIATHVFGSYVIDDDDTVWSAGPNHYGQLGNGWAEPVYQFYFDKVISGTQGEGPYLNNIESIAAGWIHSLALDKDQNLWAFGAGNSGALGQGDTENYCTPVKVIAGEQQNKFVYLENIISIGAGCAHSLAVDADGFVWSWGLNNAGQLGNRDCRCETNNPYFIYKNGWDINDNYDLIQPTPILVECPTNMIDVYYTFDEPQLYYSNTIIDWSGNYRHGRFYNINPTYDFVSQGLGNKRSLLINCDSDQQKYILMSSMADPDYRGILESRPRSISFWIEGFDEKIPHGTVASWGKRNEIGGLWDIKIFRNKIGVYITSNDANHKMESPLVSTEPGVWQHYIVILPEGKNTLQDIKIYGGILQGPITQLQSSCGVSEPISVYTQFDCIYQNPYIGISIDPNILPDPNSYAFEGLLDEFQLYPHELNNQDIQRIHDFPNTAIPLKNIENVSGGWSHSLALEKLDYNSSNCMGRVYTFGFNNNLRYIDLEISYSFDGLHWFDYDPDLKYTPTLIKGGQQGTEYLQDIISVSSGWNHCLALEKADEDPVSLYKGRVYAWGWNGDGVGFSRGDEPQATFEPWSCSGGRVGRDDLYIEEPVLIYGPDSDQDGEHDTEEGYLENISAISAGESHSIALDKNGHVWAWGSNFFGQLGTKKRPQNIYDAQGNWQGYIDTFQYIPDLVEGPDLDHDGQPDGYLGDDCPIVAIKAGSWHSLAMDAEGNVWVWGAPWAIGSDEWDIVELKLRYVGWGKYEIIPQQFDNFAFYPRPIRRCGGRVKRYSKGVLEGEYDAIQPAVNDADPNGMDEIVVYPGVYQEHISINNKSIFLHSIDPDDTRNIEKTIIDGNRFGSAVTIDKEWDEEPANAQIEISGFTIRNADQGILLKSQDPNLVVTVCNNQFRNTSTGIGANYEVFSDNNIQVIVKNNLLEMNTLCGLDIKFIASVDIENNKIQENQDAVLLLAKRGTIKNNLICENMGDLCFSLGGDFWITGNTFVNNGGRITNFDYKLNLKEFKNNILWGNSGDPESYYFLGSFKDNLNQDDESAGDPNFANLYNFGVIASLTSNSEININGVTNNFEIGDVIEYTGDGIPRIITESNTSYVRFHPGYDLTPAGDRFIFNWGQPFTTSTVTDAVGGEDWMHVADANVFHIEDVIRYGSDLNAVIITGINILDSIVEFGPSRDNNTQPGVQTINYSTYLDQMNLTHDYHLTWLSESCLDKGVGDPNVGETDIDGCARKLNGAIDYGADEFSPYTIEAGQDQEIQYSEIAYMADAELLPMDSPCTVQWELVSAPAGSAYPLHQVLTQYINPAFELDMPGEYIFKLSAYEGTQLMGADTVSVLVGTYVDAQVGAPYEAALVYDSASGLCSAQVQLLGQIRGADFEDIQILWAQPESYALADPAVNWQDGDSICTSKTITFYKAGTYEIPLVVADLWGCTIASDTAEVVITGPDFKVDAGPDRQVDWPGDSLTIELCGRVIGYPPEQVDVQWRQISGPAQVVFDPALADDIPRSGVADPNVTFSEPGLYKFQFVADHDMERRVDDLQILVGRGVLLSAGEDLYGQLTDGSAVVTTEHAYVCPDSGLNIQWYCDSEPVNGADHAKGSFAFDQAGDYELTLKAWDDSQTWTDSIMVHIYGTPSGDPGDTLYINPGTYDPVALEGGYAHVWLKDAFYDAASGQGLSCRWTLEDGPADADALFIPSPDGGLTSTALNPDAIFTESGVYLLQLEVFDDEESLGSVQTYIVVLPEGSSVPGFIDDTDPNITLTATQGGMSIADQVLTGGQIEIYAAAVDSGSGLQIVRLFLDNQFLTEVSDQIHFPANMDLHHKLDVYGLHNGRHKLTAQAWDQVPNTNYVELVFDVNVPTADQPPIAAILNLDPNVINEGTNYEYLKPPVIETGLFTLHAVAWHPEYDEPPADQNIRYKLELYSQNSSTGGWTYAGPVQMVGRTYGPDGFFHDPPPSDPNLFGDIDLTTFENGLYQLRLIVQVPGDYDWLTAIDSAQFILDCPLKIGQVKFTQEDLVIPVGGVPLRILRTYNSFQRSHNGPFGYGWTYTIAGMDIRLDEQRTILGGYMDDFGGGSDPWDTQSVRISPNYDRNVTLTLPDGRKAAFQFYLEYQPPNYFDADMGGYIARYASPPGTTARLETLETEYMNMLGAWNNQNTRDFWSGGSYAHPEFHDFSGYVLTAEDGTQYFFNRSDPEEKLLNYAGQPYFIASRGPLYLSQINTPAGEQIDFNVNLTTGQIGQQGSAGIQHKFPNGQVTKAIRFEYDSKGRIAAVYAPTEQGGSLPSVKYLYDAAGNLAQVLRLTNKAAADPNDRYEILRYAYDNPQFDPIDHYITGIFDPRGIQPIQYIYDSAGRLVATKDANGNTIELGHDGIDPENGQYEEVTDRTGNKSRYFYNSRGSVLLTQTFDSQNIVTSQTEYTYEDSAYPDKATKVTTQVPDQNDPNVLIDACTHTVYDDNGYPRIVWDPMLNVTTTIYDAKGNLLETTQWDPNAAVTEISSFPTDYPNTLPDPANYTELTTTENRYTEGNLLYFTGTRHESTWYSISLTYYDNSNRILHSIQVNPDDVAFEDLFTDGGCAQLKTVNNLPDLSTSSVTSYAYYTDPNLPGTSPDQPRSIAATEEITRYFAYNKDNVQTESWYAWDDPADGDTDPDRYIYSVSELDAQGRTIRTRRIVDDTCPRQEPYISNTLLGETFYNDIGSTDITIDQQGVLTKYEYSETGQVMETLVYESWSAFEAHYTGYPSDTTGLLSFSQTLYDADGRTILTINPCDPNASQLPIGTETVYDEVGHVVETRRWQGIQIALEDLLHSETGQVIGRKVAKGKLAANAWEDAPTGILAWTVNGTQPVVGSSAMLSRSRTEYDAAGRPWRSYLQDEDGTEICTAEYRYDLSGRQIKTISLPGTADQAVSQTLYTGLRRSAVIDARNSTTEFAYDHEGQLIRTKHPQTNYIDDSQTLQSEPLYTHTGYGGFGRKVWQSEPVPQALSENVSDDDIKVYSYSTSGRLEQISLPAVTVPEGETGAGYTFNPLYTYYYDDSGNQLAILDPKGRATVFEYDHLHRLTKKYMPFKTSYEPTVNGDYPSYDNIAGQLSTADPACEQKWYDSWGRIETDKDYKGQYTCYCYYDQNTCRDGSGFYGRPGQLWAKYYYADDYTDPENLRSGIVYTYDRLGRLLSETMTDFDEYGVEISGSARTWTYDYNARGSLIQIDSPQGTLNYSYNSITGRKVTTSTDNTKIDYGYDSLGRLNQVKTDKRDGIDIADEITAYTYNPAGSRASITLPNGAYTWYNYDAQNRLTDLKNFDEYEPTPQAPSVADVLSSFAYPLRANGMRNSATEFLKYPMGQADQSPDVDYVYDNLNRLTEESNFNGNDGYTGQYTYDLVGNRTTRTIDVYHDQGGQKVLSETLYTEYIYDPDTDRLIKEKHFDSVPLSVLPWDQNSRVYAFADSTGGIIYKFSQSDRHIGQTLAFLLGLPSAWSYWILMILLVLIPVLFLSPSLFRFALQLAGHGPPARRPHLSLWQRGLCVLLVYIFLIGPDCFQILSNAAVRYSDLSAASWGADGEVYSYWYDANGSLVYKIHADVSGIETMTLAQVQSYLQTNDTISYDYSQYNLQNRLVKLIKFCYESPNDVETVTQYAYSPSGFRTGAWTYTVINGDTENPQDETLTSYLVDPANHTGYTQVFEETAVSCDNATHTETGRTRIQYTVGDDVISQNKSSSSNAGIDWTPGTTQYLLYDGHGSTRQLLNHGGTIQDTYSYDAYGVLLQGASASPGITPQQDTSLLYAGEMFDFTGQHYYNRARWYNPLNGRFNRTDPFNGNMHDPQSLHKYLYCHANPTNSTDPSGLFLTYISQAVTWLTQKILRLIDKGYALVMRAYLAITGMVTSLINQLRYGLERFFNILYQYATNAFNFIVRLPQNAWQKVTSYFCRSQWTISQSQAAQSGFKDHGTLVKAWEKIVEFTNNMTVHHFVEQGRGLEKFDPRAIQSLANSVPIQQHLHQLISNFYSSGYRLVDFMRLPQYSEYSTVRDYISQLPWEEQWLWGKAVYDYVIMNGTLVGFNPVVYGL